MKTSADFSFRGSSRLLILLALAWSSSACVLKRPESTDDGACFLTRDVIACVDNKNRRIVNVSVGKQNAYRLDFGFLVEYAHFEKDFGGLVLGADGTVRMFAWPKEKPNFQLIQLHSTPIRTLLNKRVNRIICWRNIGLMQIAIDSKGQVLKTLPSRLTAEIVTIEGFPADLEQVTMIVIQADSGVGYDVVVGGTQKGQPWMAKIRV